VNLRNQHRLILVVGQHVDISAVGNGENVGWHFRATLASVQLGASERVHGESLVGVDSHAEETRVRLCNNKQGRDLAVGGKVKGEEIGDKNGTGETGHENCGVIDDGVDILNFDYFILCSIQ
jgi:hypothetical protein